MTIIGKLLEFFGYDDPDRTVLWQDRCPVCKRVLVTFYDDGASQIASQAGTTLAAQLPDADKVQGPEVTLKAYPMQGYGICGRCHPEAMEPPQD